MHYFGHQNLNTCLGKKMKRSFSVSLTSEKNLLSAWDGIYGGYSSKPLMIRISFALIQIVYFFSYVIPCFSSQDTDILGK